MRPEDIRDKRVLLSPLNWGMGHVSRSIGLIHQLIQQNNSVIIACDSGQESIFRMYFPELTYVSHNGYPFQFEGKGNFASDLTKAFQSLKLRLKSEIEETKQLVQMHSVDIVLSDHRYGFYSKDVPSIFVTHQYNLPLRGVQSIANRWHKKRMRPFYHIWILDEENSRLSGKLTAGVQDKRVEFIGPHSRFSFYDTVPDKKEETVVVISGPEVYAQQFANEMELRFPEALFICPEEIYLETHIRRLSGNWKEQDSAILNAQRLVSRSGYSTIMDLEILKIPALLYPTPGQAEQIYLHDRLTDCSEYTP